MPVSPVAVCSDESSLRFLASSNSLGAEDRTADSKSKLCASELKTELRFLA